MKKEDIKRVKIMYSDVVVLSKNGIFYYAYNEDAFVVSYIMGYNVKNNKVGFPENSLEKVISVFSKMKVSIYVDDMLFEFGNNYTKYLDEYKSKFEVEWLMNDLNKNIKEILKRDKDSYKIIKEYISNI